MSGWNPSYSGLSELLCSDMVREHLHHRAERIKDAAQAASPVSVAGDPPGEYRDAWTTDSGIRLTPSRRAYAEVTNPVEYAAAVEFGNGRTRGKTIEPHYILTRAIDAARD